MCLAFLSIERYARRMLPTYLTEATFTYIIVRIRVGFFLTFRTVFKFVPKSHLGLCYVVSSVQRQT